MLNVVAICRPVNVFVGGNSSLRSADTSDIHNKELYFMVLSAQVSAFEQFIRPGQKLI